MAEDKREGKIQAEIIKALSQYGMVLRLNCGRFRTFDNRWISIGVKGCPDLLYIDNHGGCAWIECKTDKGKLSDVQIDFHSKLIHMGHNVGVARSVNDALKIVGIPTIFT